MPRASVGKNIPLDVVWWDFWFYGLLDYCSSKIAPIQNVAVHVSNPLKNECYFRVCPGRFVSMLGASMLWDTTTLLR